MKKMIGLLMVIVVMLVGCVQEAPTSEDLMSDGLPHDSTSSQMVDEEFFLNGELIEVNGSRLLMDSEEAGLVWVSLDQAPMGGIGIHSIVRVQYNGVVAESYPAQATGHSLEVTQPFQKDVKISYDAMNNLLADGDVNHVIVWNGPKDIVAYATVDLETSDASYKVFVTDVYEGMSIQLAYVKGEIPDLNWFYDQLEIQTSEGSWSFGPEFEGIEDPSYIGDMDSTEIEEAQGDLSMPYSTILNTYEDKENNISIEYYQVDELLGELVEDYLNQSLYQVVKTYSNGYEDVVIKAEILKEDAYLTIAYKGEHLSLGYEIAGYITLDIATATHITVENLINDMATFERKFEEASGYEYQALEGVIVYMENDLIIFTFVPSDDSAEREYVEFSILALGPILNTSFEMPAS